MDLTKKKCVPCEGGVAPLSEKDSQRLLQSTPTWLLEAKKISRNFKFDNFVQALAFVVKIGDIAEEEGHHPDITFGWGYVNVVLNTHSIGGLSENDFIVASKIDRLL